MKAPITTAQAMSHPDVVMTINTLGKMADELRAERDALLADAERYLEKLIECRSSVKIAANEFDRFMIRKQPDANQCDIDEQIRLHDLLNWIDSVMEGKS